MNTDRFKFRVWDNEEKCYQESDADYCRINYNGELECMFTCDNGIGCRYEYIQDHCSIEQCTGLRDKNGKLIYEGDVVVQPDEYPYFDYAEGVEHKDLRETLCKIEHDAVPNYIGIVKWDDEDAQFVIVLRCVNPSKSGISDGVCHNFSDDENLEIIGNIHEGVEDARDKSES